MFWKLILKSRLALEAKSKAKGPENVTEEMKEYGTDPKSSLRNRIDG